MLNTVAASHTGALPHDGASRDEALTGDYQLAFRVGALFVPGALVIAVTVLRTPRRTTSDASAAGPAPSQAAEAGADTP